MGGAWGRITGITVNPAHWPVIPHWVSLAGRTVRVDWSAEGQDPHRLTLVSASGRRDMLVIPPETRAAAAARLMGPAAAVRTGSVQRTRPMPAAERKRGRPTVGRVARRPGPGARDRPRHGLRALEGERSRRLQPSPWSRCSS
ncbi:DUF5994 family protein [Streptomyces sp. NPDC000349]|uniref:DUF5994 family protein n=1 Tax=unclassified Streptomyces TaxID=2593676 RepID=UPI0027D902EA|nr:DUF5994 family protein [Streptomyces sp. DSM 40167]